MEKVVSWTSGTGDIVPAEFEINGNNYYLELGMSEKHGQLQQDELVIWDNGRKQRQGNRLNAEFRGNDT